MKFVWYFLGLSWGFGIFSTVCYINSRTDVLDWAYGKTWWHLPVAAAAFAIWIAVFAGLMANGTMLSMHENRK